VPPQTVTRRQYADFPETAVIVTAEPVVLHGRGHIQTPPFAVDV
jgi:hypothetical protein